METNGITIIIPVYNEEEVLEQNVLRVNSFLKGKGINHQIIIVDNGSTDLTNEIAESLAKIFENIDFFHINEKNVGGAFWIGTENAKFDKVVTVDADLSIDLEYLVRANTLLSNNDIVVGTKFTGDQDRSFMRVIGSKLYIILANFFLKLPVSDFSIGAKAYRTEKILKYKNLTSNWTGYVVELITMAKQDGLKITETPVNCLDTRKGRFNILHEGLYRYWHLLRLILKAKFGKIGER